MRLGLSPCLLSREAICEGPVFPVDQLPGEEAPRESLLASSPQASPSTVSEDHVSTQISRLFLAHPFSPSQPFLCWACPLCQLPSSYDFCLGALFSSIQLLSAPLSLLGWFEPV